jgi:hypothetical protein
VGLVGRNFEGHVGIQISDEMLSCNFSKFDLEILEQWRIVTCQLTRRWGKLADFFCSFFFSISQFRVNEHCKQIRSIHRELKSESDSFIQFAKRVVKKFK